MAPKATVIMAVGRPAPATSAPAGKAPSDEGGTLKRLEIEFADNGGATVSCYRESPTKRGNLSDYTPPSKHTFGGDPKGKQQLDDYLDGLLHLSDAYDDSSASDDASASADDGADGDASDAHPNDDVALPVRVVGGKAKAS